MDTLLTGGRRWGARRRKRTQPIASPIGGSLAAHLTERRGLLIW